MSVPGKIHTYTIQSAFCPRTGDVLIVGDGTFPCARAHFLRFDQGRWPNFTPTTSAYLIPKSLQL